MFLVSFPRSFYASARELKKRVKMVPRNAMMTVSGIIVVEWNWCVMVVLSLYYKLPQNLVFELRKSYINQDKTELLLCYWLLYILCLVSCPLSSSLSCVLFFILHHHLVFSSLYYITSLLWSCNSSSSFLWWSSDIVGRRDIWGGDVVVKGRHE